MEEEKLPWISVVDLSLKTFFSFSVVKTRKISKLYM